MDFPALAQAQMDRAALFDPVARSSSLDEDRPIVPQDVQQDPSATALFLFTNRVLFADLTAGDAIVLPAFELPVVSWDSFALAPGHIFFRVMNIGPDSLTVRFLSSVGVIPDDWFVLCDDAAMTFVRQDSFQVASNALIQMIVSLSNALLAFASPIPPPPVDIGASIALGLAPFLAQGQALLQASLSSASSKAISAPKQAEVDRLRRSSGMLSQPFLFLSKFSSLACQPAAGAIEEEPVTDALGLVPPGLPSARSLDFSSFGIGLHALLNKGQGMSSRRYAFSDKTFKNLFAFFDFQESSIQDFHCVGSPTRTTQDLHCALEDYADALVLLGAGEYAEGVRHLRHSLRDLARTNVKAALFEVQIKFTNFFLASPLTKDQDNFIFGGVYDTPLAVRIRQSMTVDLSCPDVATLLSNTPLPELSGGGVSDKRAASSGQGGPSRKIKRGGDSGTAGGGRGGSSSRGTGGGGRGYGNADATIRSPHIDYVRAFMARAPACLPSSARVCRNWAINHKPCGGEAQCQHRQNFNHYYPPAVMSSPADLATVKAYFRSFNPPTA